MAALNDSIKMITSVKTVNCVLYSEFFHKPKQNKTNNEDNVMVVLLTVGSMSGPRDITFKYTLI